MLIELSTARVLLSDDGCRVTRGRWLDPYTNQIFLDPGDLDVDHLVPLAWAHARGGHSWSSERRRAFANDPRNLFAVEASVNRSKGADGPTDWLPPNEAFQCEYITRFVRVVLTYELSPAAGEAQAINDLRRRLCGGS
jgi:hypothetical protein